MSDRYITIALVGAIVGPFAVIGIGLAISWFLDLSPTLPPRTDDEPSADFDQHVAEAIALVPVPMYCTEEEDAIARARRMLAGT